MTRAAYTRGSRVVARDVDADLASSGAAARAEREAERSDRAAMLARIERLEIDLRRSERARAILRSTLATERADRRAEIEAAASSYRFAVRTLAKAARLDSVPS